LNLSRFIASRLGFGGQSSFSGFITKMAIAAVAVSLGVMLLTSSVSRAFNATIKDKVFGFWGHVQINHLGSQQEVDEIPMNIDSVFVNDVNELPWVKSVNSFAFKPGIIKTDENINGIVLKGVGSDFNWENFESYVVEGTVPSEKNHGLISTTIAKRLNLKLGDKLRIYFIQQPVRARAFTISGIYNTNLTEFDERILFVDLAHIQKLNGWEENEVSGIEIMVDDAFKAGPYAEEIRNNYVNYDKHVSSIDRSQPEIFDWLNVIKKNEQVILAMMILVALVNMISTLLVIILERTNMVGVLKALGAPYSTIQNIFLRRAMTITSIGLVLGNILGLGLAWAQKKFEFVSLDPESYYLDVVPITFHLPSIIILNVVTFLIILVSLMLPTLLIKRIDPIKAIIFK